MANQFPRITTPKGRFLWAKLIDPDTKFTPDGEYSVQLILSEEDAAPVIAAIDSARQENLQVQKANHGAKVKLSSNLPYSPELEDDEETPTGRVIIKAKLPAQVTTRKGETLTFKPRLYNAKAKPFDVEAELGEDGYIGNGTVGKLQLELRGYYVASSGAGVKCSLLAAQIIELKKGGGQSAADRGFTDEEVDASEPTEGFGDEETGSGEDF